MSGALVGKNVADVSTGKPAETSKVEHNLQVRWDRAREAWVLCLWPGHVDDADTELNLKVWQVSTDKDLVIACGAALGAFIASEWNTDGSCELVIRTKDGRIVKGPGGRRTYGHDPETSKG